MRRADYQPSPDSRKCLGVLIHSQRRFLLLSTALAVFVWLRVKPLSLASLASVRVAAPSVRFVQSFALASCWPLPQQLLPVSATGGGRRCCPNRGALGKTVNFGRSQVHVLGFTAGGGRRCCPSRGALGIPLCLHRYSVTVLVHAPLTVADLLHGSPFVPSDTRPEPGSGLFLRQKP